MAGPEDVLQALREAVRLSPRNTDLRLHLAATLLAWGQPQEAEKEYRAALAHAPGDPRASLGLARAFLASDKDGEATVIVESLLAAPETPAEAYLLHAKLLLRAGDRDRAARAYRRARDADPELRDDAFEAAEEPAAVPTRAARDSHAATHLERPEIRFADVGGMEELKEQIRLKIIHPMTHPDIYRAYGKKAGGGVLLFGPPGCGKTHLARATAGEAKACFLSVGIEDIVNKWLGETERRLHEFCERARQNTPCVLFFDELDAIGTSRRRVHEDTTRRVINLLLSEMDGVKYDNEGVLFLGATNMPWDVDPALRRPGRFDRVMFVPPPDPPARAEILRSLLAGKPASDIDVKALAKRADGLTGADLKGVVDTAVEAKLAEAMRKGVPVPITTRDLADALKRAKPIAHEWFATARNHALYANEGGMYDDVLRYLGI
jgi:SpoVK/Ycf46/Vps4 family AAA+-type ATPase